MNNRIGRDGVHKLDMSLGSMIVCLIFSIIAVHYVNVWFFSPDETVARGVTAPPLRGPENGPEKKVLTREESLAVLQNKVTGIRGASAVVIDMHSGEVLAQKNAKTRRSLASLTKVVTATLAYQAYKSTSSRAVILPRIQYMMTSSSNEEAQALSSAFANTESGAAAAMTRYTKEYGLSFKNVSGLDIIHTEEITDEFGSTTASSTRERSTEGSALGFARFATDAYRKYPEFFDTTIRPRGNTNIVTNQLNFMLGGKTGFTDLSGGNLMVIVLKGISHPYMIVVLGSTEKGRFVDVENIASALLQLNI